MLGTSQTLWSGKLRLSTPAPTECPASKLPFWCASPPWTTWVWIHTYMWIFFLIHMDSTKLSAVGWICGCGTTRIQGTDYGTRTSSDFGIGGGSWNQFLADIRGWMYIYIYMYHIYIERESRMLKIHLLKMGFRLCHTGII